MKYVHNLVGAPVFNSVYAESVYNVQAPTAQGDKLLSL